LILLLLAPCCTSFVRGLNGLRCLNGLRGLHGLRGLRGLRGLLGSHHSLCQNNTPAKTAGAPRRRRHPQARFQERSTHLPSCPSPTASFSACALCLAKVAVFAEPSGFQTAYCGPVRI
jgi:hypothetical protein